VDDIVDGLVAAIDRAPAFDILNLGGSSPISLSHLIDAIGEVVGAPLVIDRRERHAGDVEQTYADLGRSRAVLGYEPKVPLIEGLRRQWDWAQRSFARSG
jgi:UDP-glucuronate 4-epimerase